MSKGGLLLIAGAGRYPLCLASGAKRAGVERLVVLAFRGQTDRSLKALADEHYVLGVGELAKVQALIRSLHEDGVDAAVVAGQITPSALFRTRFDPMLRALMRSLPVKSAHSIFGALLGMIEDLGVRVLPASVYMEDFIPSVGTLTARAPDKREEADIRRGYEAAMAAGTVDVGQTVVVKDGMVLAVEAFEGTNAAIRRGAKLGGRGAVVVKTARAGHDMRFDIPVIGAKTIAVMRRNSVSALAFQAGRTILLDREEALRAADKAGIAVVALPTDLPPAPTRP